ncbi:MAG TPA: hypothetical protein VMV77_02275 [Bacteroidales bacterium]|nr:hypothetical protein [Bacteroidales bacterium]
MGLFNFKKKTGQTVAGKLLGGLFKIGKVAVPLVAGVVTGGAALGVLSGAKIAGKVGIFKKIGSIFKKKEGGTVLGNLLRGTAKKVASGAVSTVGEEIGSTAHQIASTVGAGSEGETSGFVRGMKTGFLGDVWENNKGFLIAGVLGLIGLLILIFGRRRR